MKDFHEILVDTLSSINVNSGMVRLFFVERDLARLGQQNGSLDDIELTTKQVVAMPIPGFLYMASVMKRLLDDPKFQEQLERLKEAGFIGAVAGESADATELEPFRERAAH